MPVLGDGECLSTRAISLSYMSGFLRLIPDCGRVHVDTWPNFTIVISLAQGQIGLIRNALCDGAG